jgi:hypothetical protein
MSAWLDLGSPLGLALMGGLLLFGATTLVGAVLLSRRKEAGREKRTRVWMRRPTKALSDPFLAVAWADRRQASRRRGNPVKVILGDPETRRPVAEGLVFDRSLGGLCLQVTEPLEVDTVILVRPGVSNAELPWTKVCVRHCRPEGRHWAIGCQFLESVPWTTMMHFG